MKKCDNGLKMREKNTQEKIRKMYNEGLFKTRETLELMNLHSEVFWYLNNEIMKKYSKGRK
jgi:hypothetical protein